MPDVRAAGGAWGGARMSGAPIILRPYQEKMVAETREALRAHRAVLLQLPTGGG